MEDLLCNFECFVELVFLVKILNLMLGREDPRIFIDFFGWGNKKYLFYFKSVVYMNFGIDRFLKYSGDNSVIVFLRPYL